MKLRGAIIKDRELILLPKEQVFKHVTGEKQSHGCHARGPAAGVRPCGHESSCLLGVLRAGVWNLSSDQGNLGTFYITDVRLVRVLAPAAARHPALASSRVPLAASPLRSRSRPRSLARTPTLSYSNNQRGVPYRDAGVAR